MQNNVMKPHHLSITSLKAFSKKFVHAFFKSLLPPHLRLWNDDSPDFILPMSFVMELVSAGFAWYWTVLLLLPVHLFSRNILFLGLSHMGSEHYWAIATLLLTVWQVGAWFSPRPFWRCTGLILAASLWAFVARGTEYSAPVWHHLVISTSFWVYEWTSILCVIFACPFGKYLYQEVCRLTEQARLAWAKHKILQETERLKAKIGQIRGRMEQAEQEDRVARQEERVAQVYRLANAGERPAQRSLAAQGLLHYGGSARDPHPI